MTAMADALEARAAQSESLISIGDALSDEQLRKDAALDRAAAQKLRQMDDALAVTERALLSDPPCGPQKSIYGDGVIYHLDGQTCGHALHVVRAARRARTET